MFGIFNRGHTAFDMGKPLKTGVLTLICSPKATLNICKFLLHFLQCEEKFSADALFFEICMFEACQNVNWTTRLSLRTHHSVFTCAAALL